MPRCSGCSGDRCSCVIQAGENVTVTGAGTFVDPFIVSAESSGEGGGSGFKTGDVKMSAVVTPEAGWLVANGAAVSRAAYSALFTAIGTTYGAGDGATTFNLPDLAGRFPLGADGTHAHGGIGGQEGTTLDVTNLPGHQHTMAHVHSITHTHPTGNTAAENAAHTHSGSTAGTGTHQHAYTSQSGTRTMVPNGGGVGSAVFMVNPTVDAVTPDGFHAHNFDTSVETAQHGHGFDTPTFTGNSGPSSVASTGFTGSGVAFTNMPPWTGVTFLIKT